MTTELGDVQPARSAAPAKHKPVRKTVATLLINDCRWPIGDPQQADFHFCGEHKPEGSSYCDYHAQLSRQTAQRRYRPYIRGER
jgi:hypothetical protein